ncbi:MAG TPA: hypothetical protein VJO53_09405 [Candidatus Acidoferrales bacterium]|nr:hypothetical protein [Candidatus Acidoferrales bacterium]
MRNLRGKTRLFFWPLTCLLAAWFTGCQVQINYPMPSLAATNPITPSHLPAGQSAFILTVNGNNFTPASSVLWNQSARSTIFVSTSELTAQVLASDIQNAGTASVAVESPQPGGGITANPATFTIDAVNSPVPQVTSLSPSGVFTGSGQFTLAVTGKNFVSQSMVTVNGSNRQTIFLNSTSVEARIAASDVASGGSVQIAVVNPPPGGGGSNSIALRVKNPVPGIASLSPVAILAGSTDDTLSVTGTNFVPDSAVMINGAPRTTVFVASSQLQATLNAGDLTAAGVNQVQVVSPADGGTGGGTSNILTFSVNANKLAGLPLLVDLAPDGTQANNGICGATCAGAPPNLALATAGPAVSQTGQFVAFASNSTNLVATPANTSSDIFLRDTCLSSTTTNGGASSCTPKTSIVNTSASGGAADGPSTEPSLDSAGAHAAYTSTAGNLVSYVSVPGGTRQVYWQPTCTSGVGVGTACTGSSFAAVLVSISADGSGPGNGESFNPVISFDGRYVAFVSLATNLVNVPGVTFDGVTPQVFLRDTCNGSLPNATISGCGPGTFLVSISPDGTSPANGPSSHPAISNQGLFVSFTSSAPNLGAPAPNPNPVNEIFERSTCVTTIALSSNTCAPTTSLISTPDGTTPGDGESPESSISNDGRFVAFSSSARNLIVGVGPTQQVYVRDTCTGVAVATPPTCTPSTTIASTPDGTTPANALSEHPSVSQCGTTTNCATGQIVSFASFATNLGPSVANGVENIFVRNSCAVLPSSTAACVKYTLLASKPAGTLPASSNGDSFVPAISGDGHTVGFLSLADNLVPRDSNAFEDVFLADATLKFKLDLTLMGTGSGTVSDTTGQINCVQTAAIPGNPGTPETHSGTCSARYISGTSVTLTASAGTGATFQTWGGSVIGTSCVANSATSTTCQFSVTQDNTATASFK